MTPGQRMTAMSAARGSRAANEFYLAQPTGYFAAARAAWPAATSRVACAFVPGSKRCSAVGAGGSEAARMAMAAKSIQTCRSATRASSSITDFRQSTSARQRASACT